VRGYSYAHGYDLDPRHARSTRRRSGNRRDGRARALKALILDLDGTLVDSTYQHVLAWQRAFASIGITLPAIELHRRIGMNGSLMISAIARAFSLDLDATKRAALQAGHKAEFLSMRDVVPLLPEAGCVAEVLANADVPWAIVTSGTQSDIGPFLERVHADRASVVITGDDEHQSKPAPRPLDRAIDALGIEAHDAAMVGDAVWDMLGSREAGCFGVGVLSGGSAREELAQAGAYRVYRNVAELLRRLEELGLGQ
jgi:HAD superfamily hydrolase (TIGR01549 family)